MSQQDFLEACAIEAKHLFEHVPAYKTYAKEHTPEEMAQKTLEKIQAKETRLCPLVRATIKRLGLKPSMKAVREFISC
jgi:hypothetical protein